MYKSVVEHFSLDKNKFEATGAFNPLLSADTHLFIDPFLLKDTQIPEFIGAYDEIIKYFTDILLLIPKIKTESTKDEAWKVVVKQLTFSELGAFGLGYSFNSIGGRGGGNKTAVKMTNTAIQIYAVGKELPQFFIMSNLLQEGIGPDTISDMVCKILIR